MRNQERSVQRTREIPSSEPAYKLLTGDDVASLLQVSRSFAYTLMRRGEIPCVRLGRAVRVRPEDLQKFIEGGVCHSYN